MFQSKIISQHDAKAQPSHAIFLRRRLHISLSTRDVLRFSWHASIRFDQAVRARDNTMAPGSQWGKMGRHIWVRTWIKIGPMDLQIGDLFISFLCSAFLVLIILTHAP
eukprot:s105_g11.t1